ncbi:MAG: amidase [Polaromonas sp.]|uniref:amidase n=1 Tax=Polaromonas sp. TaxID=1869339 RepID=UPI002736C90F|nr:amidase [Polaromonas sp.]MDP3795971.1 amidase [Polaromonas sp.]
MTPAASSAIATAAQLAAGKLDATTLLADTLARIDAQDAALGAFVALLSPSAAREQLAQLREAGGPLQGLPVAVKDIFDTAGLPTSYGSALYAGAQPRCDAAIVSVIRRAGGLVIGKSSTTEFAFLHPTATRNPNAPGRTPGGSSAGSAAAVAAGLVPFAVGTQTGGSIIRPASYCGVTGFKPSFGLLPTAGLKCFSWSLDTVGLFARNVAEVAWFSQAVSGHALALPAAQSTPAASSRPWVVGVPDAYPWGPVSPSAQRAIDAGSRALRAAGARVLGITLPAWMKDVFEAQDVIQGYEAWRALAREVDLLARQPEALSAILRDYLITASRISAPAYEAAQQTARQGRQACADWFGQFDVLMTPSAPDEAPPGYGSTGASTFNRAWTLLGLPCVNVAGAVGVNGLPMGLQVIGAPRADHACLEAADFLERSLRAT